VDEPAWGREPSDSALVVEALGRVFGAVKKAKRAVQVSFGALEASIGALAEAPVDIAGLDFIDGRRDLSRLGVFRKTDKALSLGLFDARGTRLEDEADVLDVLRALPDAVGPRDVYLTTNCGLEFLPRDRAQRKLAHMVAVARRAKEVLA
jgi:5-methyltetrahydropteroyltriglutamate--homocysteine methyltransferase